MCCTLACDRTLDCIYSFHVLYPSALLPTSCPRTLFSPLPCVIMASSSADAPAAAGTQGSIQGTQVGTHAHSGTQDNLRRAEAMALEEFRDFLFAELEAHVLKLQRVYKDHGIVDQKVADHQANLEKQFGPGTESFATRVAEQLSKLAPSTQGVGGMYSATVGPHVPIVQAPEAHVLPATAIAASASGPQGTSLSAPMTSSSTTSDTQAPTSSSTTSGTQAPTTTTSTSGTPAKAMPAQHPPGPFDHLTSVPASSTTALTLDQAWQYYLDRTQGKDRVTREEFEANFNLGRDVGRPTSTQAADFKRPAPFEWQDEVMAKGKHFKGGYSGKGPGPGLLQPKGKGDGPKGDVKGGGLKGKGDEPKGKGGFRITNSMQAALRENEEFLETVGHYLRTHAGQFGVPANTRELVDSRLVSDLEHLVDFWINTRYAHRARCGKDELAAIKEIIVEEWHQCILRQLLFSFHGIFADSYWDNFRRNLMISHSGHLLDPETRFAIWHRGGSPQPSCAYVDADLAQFGTTHDAISRPRTRDADRDPDHVPRTVQHWLPRNLRIPPVILRHRNDSDLQKNQCYCCKVIGHTAENCPILLAVYLVTDAGQNACRTIRWHVPQEIAELPVVQLCCTTLALVLKFRYPLDEACVLVQDLNDGNVPSTYLDDQGDYIDRQTLLQALGQPRSSQMYTFARLWH